MSKQEILKEVVTALNNLEPNKVIDLSDEAGIFLLDTVKDMQENGEI